MKVIIRDNIFKVKLCTTQDSVSKGMMGKRFDKDFNGMLFMMPSSGKQSFWTYNCVIPLDIIMINNGVIDTINHSCPPCEMKENCESYTGIGNEVLELHGGTCKKLGIKKGDRVSFSLV
jgi:uncharacterized protein